MFSVDAPRAAGHQANECGPLDEDGTPGIHQKRILTRTYNSSVIPPAQFNVIATAIFGLAVVHTFLASRFLHAAHRAQRDFDERAVAAGLPTRPSARAGMLHFFGETEVIFGLWVIPLMLVVVWARGFAGASTYLNDEVHYTEALFVVVIMALASTRPVVGLAESMLSLIAALGGRSAAAWWITILIVAPLLGSLITEPAAMTIAALLLARQFFDRHPPKPLKYATIGLLFVNVSIGGTLTHFAAPPVLMVARVWDWDTLFMLEHFGWRAVAAIVTSTALYYLVFRRDFRDLATAVPAWPIDADEVDSPVSEYASLPVPWWVTAVHLAFMAWTVINSHHPVLFIGGFLFFLGFSKATVAYQTEIDLKTPLLVGFFLAGLVIHGGLQGWWITPLLSRLGDTSLFLGATVLTAFNDNALITYLSTLVPDLTMSMKTAVVEGAVTGGGLTVIANAPNPAGQALLSRYFIDGVNPLRLAAAAIGPTLIAAAAFRLFL
jgi:hypothetical protein